VSIHTADAPEDRAAAASDSPTPPAAGLIGPGTIGRLHAAALADLGVPLAGVVGSSQAAGERAAAELATRPYATVEELLADETVGVVHICTPHPLHPALARAALAAGKHVVCEKPLALDVGEARALATAADAAAVVHAVGHDQRFADGIPQLRRAVAAGELGEVHLAQGVFLLDEVRTLDPGHWMLDPARGGTSLTLADIGVHWWDLLEHVTGERVVAGIASTRSLRAGGLDDSAVIGLRLTGGVQAVASLSQAVATPGRLTLELAGTEGAAAWEGAEGRDPAQAAAAKRASFGALLRAVYDDVSAGRPAAAPAYATFHDGAHGVAVLAALLDSVSAGDWRLVSDTPAAAPGGRGGEGARS
jgi:predicted dehydrogenase